MAHLTSHSRRSSSRWVITPLWLSELLKFFLYNSVYSCYLFLISSPSIRSIPFLSFIVPTFAWNAPLLSLIFLTRSLVFPSLLFSSVSLHWFLSKAFLSLLPIFGTLHSDGFIFPFLLFLSLIWTVCINYNTEQYVLIYSHANVNTLDRFSTFRFKVCTKSQRFECCNRIKY